MHDARDSGHDEEGGIHWEQVYQMIKCQGCDRISFRETVSSSEDFDPYTGEAEVTERLYPERAAGRSPMPGSEYFPARTRRVYQEVLKAMNTGSPILAAIGLRAIVESVCAEKNVPGSNLEKRIDKLADMGVLASAQAEFLHGHRFLGNTAAHEITAPKPQELVAALDIAETLLKTIYVLPQLAPEITTGVKPRKSVSSPKNATKPPASKSPGT